QRMNAWLDGLRGMKIPRDQGRVVIDAINLAVAQAGLELMQNGQPVSLNYVANASQPNSSFKITPIRQSPRGTPTARVEFPDLKVQPAQRFGAEAQTPKPAPEAVIPPVSQKPEDIVKQAQQFALEAVDVQKGIAGNIDAWLRSLAGIKFGRTEGKQVI